MRETLQSREYHIGKFEQNINIFYFSFHCSVDMKCMVSYIQWYHEPFNGNQVHPVSFKIPKLSIQGTLKLLRTGASSGDPYSYFIKVLSEKIYCGKFWLLKYFRWDFITFWLPKVRINCTVVALLAFYTFIRLSLPHIYFFFHPDLTVFVNNSLTGSPTPLQNPDLCAKNSLLKGFRTRQLSIESSQVSLKRGGHFQDLATPQWQCYPW